MPRAFRINTADNVATMLDDAPEGVCDVLGQGPTQIELREPMKLGHKIALCDIAAGLAIMKFGVRIGHASKEILKGQWVHLHNCASDFDQRSQTLELQTGASTDTKYE